MAHMQKPDFVFRRNGRVDLNRWGRQFSQLLAAEVCASAVVMLDTPCSEVVWRVLATHSIRQFPLHFPSRASLCAITFQLDSTVHTCINVHVQIHKHATDTPIQWVLGHSQRYKGQGVVLSAHPNLGLRFQKEQSYTSVPTLYLHSTLWGELSLLTTGTLFIMTIVSSHFLPGCLHLYKYDMYQTMCLLRCDACL